MRHRLKRYNAAWAVPAALSVALLLSCSDSEDSGPVAPDTTPPGPRFEDLTKKEHVLNNLAVSYVQRDILEYRRIIDPDYFQFFFSDADVSHGLPPDGWDKTQDDAATANLLNRNNPSPNRILSIDVQVDSDGVQWVETDADPPLAGKWYTVVTTYRFAFKAANDFVYATRGNPAARFTVRNIGTDAAPQWRLVRWQDLGNVSLVRIIPPGAHR